MPRFHHQVLVAAAILAGTMAQAVAAEDARHGLPPLLAAHDADKDGRLTLTELETARRQQLARFDRDGDGRLSTEEYQALWLDDARDRVARQFQADDRNHDGSVTIEELNQRSADLVRRRDADQDGALTAEELRPRHRTRQASAASTSLEKISAVPTTVE
jgi:Ca2+-binding EF-hand superfamily protein